MEKLVDRFEDFAGTELRQNVGHLTHNIGDHDPVVRRVAKPKWRHQLYGHRRSRKKPVSVAERASERD